MLTGVMSAPVNNVAILVPGQHDVTHAAANMEKSVTSSVASSAISPENRLLVLFLFSQRLQMTHLPDEMWNELLHHPNPWFPWWCL